jgi:hypothetical protein
MTPNAIRLVIPRFTHDIAAEMPVIGLARGLATELAEFSRASAVAGGHAGLPRWAGS